MSEKQPVALSSVTRTASRRMLGSSSLSPDSGSVQRSALLTMQAVQSLLPKNKSAVEVVGLVVEHNTKILNSEQGIDTSNRPLTSCKIIFSSVHTMKVI